VRRLANRGVTRRRVDGTIIAVPLRNAYKIVTPGASDLCIACKRCTAMHWCTIALWESDCAAGPHTAPNS